jgi:GrxC family glutaredoxin
MLSTASAQNSAPEPENGGANKMVRVVIYITTYCPYCTAAKSLLHSKNVTFEEIDVTSDPDRRAEMEQLSQRRTVPQIFIDGQSIGGYDDARRLDSTGELDRLLGLA